jgi:DNA polymerase II large subunit
MAETIVQAYTLVEYIAEGREVKPQKRFENYVFKPENGWTCLVDNNAVKRMSAFPTVFKIHLEAGTPGDKVMDYEELLARVGRIESRLDDLEKPKRGRPAKEE